MSTSLHLKMDLNEFKNASCSLLVTRGIDRLPSVKGKSDIQAGKNSVFLQTSPIRGFFSINGIEEPAGLLLSRGLTRGWKNLETERNISFILPCLLFSFSSSLCTYFRRKSLMRNSMTAIARDRKSGVMCFRHIGALH